MESLFVLIPLAIILAGCALRALFWAIDHHQFEDLDSAAHSILFDEKHDSDVVVHSTALEKSKPVNQRESLNR